MENRIHFVFGDNSYVETYIGQTKRRSYTRSRCVQAEDASTISGFLSIAKKESNTKLLILDNFQHLNENNIRNLDFIFRLSDHSREIDNLDLYLLADKSFFNDSCIAENKSKLKQGDETIWRSYLSQRFHSYSRSFNGIAFSGRIQHFGIQHFDSYDSSRDNDICSNLFPQYFPSSSLSRSVLNFSTASWSDLSIKRFVIQPSDSTQNLLALLLPLLIVLHFMSLWKYC